MFERTAKILNQKCLSFLPNSRSRATGGQRPPPPDALCLAPKVFARINDWSEAQMWWRSPDRQRPNYVACPKLLKASHPLVVSLFLFFPSAFAADKKLNILTTFLPAYCIAINVAGNAADVQNLIPASTNPHDYQLTPSDMRKLAGADVIVMNGLGLEGWLKKALASNSRPQRKTVELAAGLKSQLIETEHGHSHAHDEGHVHHDGDINPHIWLDPILAAHAVTNVLTTLTQADPANSAVYSSNAAVYVARLHKLNADIATSLQPVKTKPFVTYHNAFPYFGKRYGLNIIGVVLETPDVAPSPRYLSKLSKEMRAKKVVAIFTETQSGARIAKQLAADLKLPTAELNTLEAGPLSPTAYEDGMRQNAQTLARTLGANGK